MLLSYFNHPTDARARVRPRLRAIVTGECIPLRQYRGNMNGKMNGVSFCSRTLLLHVLFIAYQFSPLLSYAHFNLAIARAPHRVPVREIPWAVFISASTDESGSRRLSDDHLASINNPPP